MCEIRHVLMTRFNLATGGREIHHRLQSGWLETRLDLFERYCLPSVAAQKDQGFDWIIYFDQATPDWARARIAAAQRTRPFHAYFTSLFDADGWNRTVTAVLGARRGGAILTSNLDNDDAIATHYLSDVRCEAELWVDRAPLAINYLNGVVRQGSRIYRHRHSHNAFTNLLEPSDKPLRTACGVNHMALPGQLRLVQIEGPPGWLQLVHGGNVSNRVRGGLTKPEEAGRSFPSGCVQGLENPPGRLIIADRFLFSPARALRDVAFRILRRIRPVRR